MAIDPNEKELTIWGFTKGFRTGLITFLLSVQMLAIVYLYIEKGKTEREKYDDQAKRYQEMIEYMKPTKDRMNDMADKVDTAATRVINTSDKVDSLTSALNNRKKPK